MKKTCLFLIGCCMSLFSISQTVIPLYPHGIPDAKAVPDEEHQESRPDGRIWISKVSHPTLTVFLPEKGKANGTAVVICPGGGYHILAMTHEGYDVAKRFNEMGVTAFVLKYRLPDDHTMINKTDGPIEDAQRAIQLVRQRAGEWKINPHRVGIVGFSAGGHLASTAGTHFQKDYIDNPKHTSLRPDFMILGYPVISFSDSIGHRGSRNNLLGEHPSPELIREYSNELQVTANTPPTFLVQARDDQTVPVANSIHFYEALQKKGVPSEIYLYEKGGHGFGLHNATSDVQWMDLVEAWMKKNGWVH